MNGHSGPRARFDAALAVAETGEDAFAALEKMARETVGVKLFTVMTVDMDAMLARRAYSSEPVSYPASGTKPIVMNDWFETVATRHELFVANTLQDIARVFPDHETIGALGCGSVVNLPVVIEDKLAATVNLLDEPRHYTPERVNLVTTMLAEPALAAVRWAARCEAWPGSCS